MRTRSQTAAAAAGGDYGGEDPQRHMKATEELFKKPVRPGVRKLKVKLKLKELPLPEPKGARSATSFKVVATYNDCQHGHRQADTHERSTTSCAGHPYIGTALSSLDHDQWLNSILDSEIIRLYKDKAYDESKNIIVVDDEDMAGVEVVPPLPSLGSDFDRGSVFDAPAGSQQFLDDEASSS